MAATLSVLAPTPVLTVTIERGGHGDEIHLHGGGQGFWVARLAARLGAEVVLCAPLGGEPGRVLHGLIEAEGITLQAVESQGWNGAYVHDRRGGERVALAETASATLGRHELDDLYGAALAAGLQTGVMLLTGPQQETAIEPDIYRRLAADLRAGGARVLADLTGRPLEAALTSGIELTKMSDDALVQDGFAHSTKVSDLVAGLQRLRERGARNVLVSREEQPALAALEERLFELAPPRFEARDPHGAGDSQSAAIAVALAGGSGLEEALRLGTAAGALNVTRRGLGTGDRESIERLVSQVDVREL